MNDKERQLEQLSAYLDGELAAAEALEVETLLAEDEDLRAELESLRQTRELLRLMPAEPAPKHFAHEVMARAERHHHLGAEAPGGPWRLTRWVTLATAAVVLISAGLALMIIANLPEQTLPGPLGEADAPAARESEEGGRADGSDIVVAGARPADGETTAEVITEAIWTDDLTRTQREVEEVLVAEGLEAEEPLEARRRASSGIVRAQVFNVQRVKPTQVQLEVDVSVDRIEELKTALTRLRQQQRVVQGPVVFATGEEMGDVAGGAKLRDVATSDEDTLTEAEEPPAAEIAAAPSKPSVPPQDVEMTRTKADTRGAPTETETKDDRAAAGGDAGPSVAAEEDDADEAVGKARVARRFPVQRIVITLNYRAAGAPEADIEAADEPDFSSDDAPGD